MNPSSLPEPSFVERDPAKITSEMIAEWEAVTGKKLQPAQPERLLIDIFAYRESLVRISIQEAAMLNLVRFSRFPMLDYLGELLSVVRLSAAPSRTIVRFTLAGVQAFDVLVRSGTRVETADGKFTFVTSSDATIAAGQTNVDATAVASVTGAAANGYLAGQINLMVDPIAYVASAANTITSLGGADQEADEAMKDRIEEAPESFATTGPEGAYRFWAMSAHADIVDVAVISPSATVVNVYPLLSSGNPDQTMLDLVFATLSPRNRRPLTDDLHVLAPTEVEFTIEADVTIYSWAAADIQERIEAACAAYAAGMRATLAEDGIIMSQISAIISNVEGVYKVALVTPAADTELAPNEWANCTAITINIVGTHG